MNVRKAIPLFLAIFIGILVLSYGLIGYLLYRQYRPPQPFSQRLSQPSSQEQSVQALLKTAEKNLRNKEVEQALIAYRRVLSLRPDSLAGQLGLARCELLAGREQVASHEYEKAVSLDEKNTTALLALARIYSYRADTWRQSEARFKEYLALRPEEAQARLGLARVLAWQGKSREAADIFSREEVARLMTDEDQRNYAFALVKAGRWHHAEAQLRKLLAGHPHDLELQLQLASIYASRREWDSALPIYRSLLQEKPNDSRLNLTYGLGLLSMKNYRAALAPLEKARRGMPSSGEAGLGYARALKGTGHLKEAIKEFDRVIPQYRNNAGIVREYADVLLEKRDYRKSEQYYKVAYSSGLRDDRLLVGLAGALRGNGKNKEALPYLETVYRRQPTDRLAFELAKLLRKLGRHDRALEYLSKIENPSRQVAGR